MKRLLFLLPMIVYSPINTTILVQNFPRPIASKVFDRATGTFYVGLESGGGVNAISVGSRPDYGASSTFTGIATNGGLNGNAIKFLTLATSTGNLNPLLAIVIDPPGTQEPMSVVASTTNGKFVGGSDEIRDGSNSVNQNGSITSGIVGLAANQSFIFPVVKPCNGDFGANCNGGIASVAIPRFNDAIILSQVAAVPGDGGIKAQKLDPTTPAVYIDNSPSITPNKVDIIWDDQLQRLYTALEVQTPGLSSDSATCATGSGTCVTGFTQTCPSGLYFFTGSFECITCPSGGFFSSNTQQCELCPSGQLFNAAAGVCQTQTCPANAFFNYDPNAQTCVTCPAGFNPDFFSQTCAVCPNSGIYNPTIPGCVPCPSGYIFSIAAGTCVAVPSTDCPSGQSFCPNINACVTTITCPANFIFDPGQSCVTCVADPNLTGPSGFGTEIIPQPFLLGINGPLNEPTQTLEVPNLYTPIIGRRSYGLRAPIPSGARAVVVGQVDSGGAITLQKIAPDTAFDSNNHIVGVYDAVPRSVTINKVRVMHASTGPSYLIVNGGDSSFGATNNTIYALPLVDLSDSTNPLQGTLADKNSSLVNYKFVVPALNTTQVPLASDPASRVGDGPLGILPSSAISDIDVVGDTVYVSINNSPSFGSEGGILYSQAMFDESGKIIRWTPWTLKAFPPFGLPPSSAVSMFAVDAVVAKLWVIDNSQINVYQNSWTTRSSDPNSLLTQVNLIITGAAIGILDLDQSTRGFLSNFSRYTLFSGGNNVVFARVSQSTGGFLNSPQLITSDFSNPTNFTVKTLPDSSCQVTVMEYARQLAGTPSNYFFAGTRNGLFVFSVGGNGFDVATMGAVNAPPFSTGSWSQVPNSDLMGVPIADIKTTGNALYVLTQNSVLGSALYRIPFQTTVAAMFAPGNVFKIAETGVGIFAKIVIFSGMQIISTTANGSTEQIVLATNNGLFESTRAGGVQAATSQADAAWIQIPNTNFYYNGIGKMDNASIPVASPSTIWPFHISNAGNQSTFERSIWQQLNGTIDAGPFAFVPPFFNSIEVNNPVFATVPLGTYFWSDGARRISIVANVESSCAPGQLLCLPFDTLEWDIDNPEEAVLVDPVLNEVIALYWIKQIGVTGLLMAGTNLGVIALA